MAKEAPSDITQSLCPGGISLMWMGHCMNYFPK